jgi:hypothetical protein
MSVVFAVLLPRFENLKRGIAVIGNEGSRSGIFRFRRQRLAAIADADRFFFRSFDRARGRPGAS